MRSAFPAIAIGLAWEWDGKDSNGRVVQGSMDAWVTVSYVYGIVYRRTAGFGLKSIIGTSWSVRRSTQVGDETKVTRISRVRVGQLLATPANSLGGWTLSSHHDLDRGGHVLHRGDGGREVKKPTTVLPFDSFPTVSSMAVAADGTLYHGAGGQVWRTRPDGTRTRYAGRASGLGFAGDGGQATDALLNGVRGLALSSDGTLYIKDGENRRIRRVTPEGIITTIAGNGQSGTGGDGGPALAAQLDQNSVGIALGADGALYINCEDRIRRVGADGIIRTFDSGFFGGRSIAIGPDDSVYFLESQGHRVWRLRQDAARQVVAGNGAIGVNGDNGPATSAAIFASSISVGADGVLYLDEQTNIGGGNTLTLVRRVGTDGIISRYIGGKVSLFCPTARFNTAPLDFQLCSQGPLVAGPTNTLYVHETGHGVLKVAEGVLDAASILRLPSEDGSLVYELDSLGRHLRTLSSLTATPLEVMSYDTSGRLERVTDVNGNAVTIEYDTDRAWITGPYGQRTELQFNADGYLERVTDPIGESTTITYTPGKPGLLQTFSHPFSGTSSMTYDAQGRLLRDTSPGGGWQEYTITPQPGGRKITRTTRLGRNSDYVWRLVAGDAVERRITDPAGLTTVATRDRAGKRVVVSPDGTRTEVLTGPDARFGLDSETVTGGTVTLPSGRSVTATATETVTLGNAADPLSLLKKTITATVNGLRTTRLEYDAPTRTLTTTTPAGRQFKAVLDSLGRVTDVIPPGLASIHYEYDTRGRVREVRQGSRVTTTTYDADGRVDTVTGPDGKTVSYDHDALGRPVRMTRPDGSELTVSYENHGRRTSLTPPDKPAHLEELDPENRTTDYIPPSVPGASSQRHAQFDDDGGVTRITFGARAGAQLVDVARDAAGRVTQVTSPRGTHSRAYDAAGRLEHLTTPEGVTHRPLYDGSLVTGMSLEGPVPATASFTYDPELQLQSETINSNTVAFTHDADGLLTSAGELEIERDPLTGFVDRQSLGGVSWQFSRNTFGETDDLHVTFAGTDLFRAEVLARDGAGRITLRRETTSTEIHTYDYEYDLVGRLTDVTVDGIATSHYEYDANGNRILAERDGTLELATYDAQDRLLSRGPFLYTYTLDGALESKTDTRNDETTTYDYDLNGELLGVTLPNGDQVEYVLDGTGRRVGRKVNGVYTHRWAYGSGPAPVAEIDAGGNVLARYVYASHAWVPDYVVRNGETLALVTDRVGSVRTVLDVSSGSPVVLQYDEFGRPAGGVSQVASFGFAGGLWDPTTRLVRLGARDYDSEVGRWISKDPILFRAGDSNLYAYVANDPINLIDPTGHNAEAEVAKTCVRNPAACAAAGVFAAGMAIGIWIRCTWNGPCDDMVDDVRDWFRDWFSPPPTVPLGDAIDKICEPMQSKDWKWKPEGYPFDRLPRSDLRPKPPKDPDDDDCTARCLPYLGTSRVFIGNNGSPYTRDLGGEHAFQRCYHECMGHIPPP